MISCRLARSIAFVSILAKALCDPLAVAGQMAALPPPPSPARWAILIGDGRGDHRPAIAAALREAAATLRETYGYAPERVIELYGPDTSRDAIRETIDRLSPRTSPNDSLFAYVILPTVDTKHGQYLLPAGGTEGQVWTLIRPEEILAAVALRNFRTSLTIVNTCVDAASMREAPTKQSNMGLSKSGSTLTACEPDAEDRGARRVAGAFTSVLRATTDKDRIGELELVARLRAAVQGVRIDLERDGRYRDGGFAFIVDRRRTTTIVGQLESATTPAEQIRAIETLSNVARATNDRDTRDEGVRRIADVAKDESATRAVRLRAIGALGATGADRAIMELAGLAATASEPEIRRGAVEALARIGSPPSLAAVLKALSDPSASVRVAAVRGAGGHRLLSSASPIVARIADADADVRVAALQMVALLAKAQAGARNLITPLNNDARKATRAALSDPSATIRREAVNTLSRLGVDLAREPIVLRLLTSDPDSSVRRTVALTIGREYRALSSDSDAREPQGGRGGRGGPASKQAAERDTATSALLRAAAPPGPADVRAAAMWALGEIADPKGRDTLVGGLTDAAPGVRESAAEGLGKMGDRSTLQGIIALLDDEYARVRATAARALGLLRDPAANEPLLQRLSRETDSYARQTVEQALKRLPSPSMASLRSDSPLVRRSAVDRLATSKDPDAAQSAIDTLADPDPDVRRSARAVVDQRGAEWLDVLVANLSSTQIAVRRGVIEALGNVASAAAGEALLSHWSREANPMLRSRIVRSLGLVRPTSAAIEDLLVAAALDPDNDLRLEAVTSLASYPTRKVRDILESLATTDDEGDIRDSAIRSLRAMIK
jgi:HEAT repeat protein